MGNPFVHAESMSTDVAKAKAFYAKLSDWELEDMAGMTYECETREQRRRWT
jgi:predicted enzyme related to lactoylglutathione lyase